MITRRHSLKLKTISITLPIVLAMAIHSAFSQTLPVNTPDLPVEPLAGVWENRSRFVEFAEGKGMRIVLKPYYGFVYEDTGWIPASVSNPAAANGSAAATLPPGDTALAAIPGASAASAIGASGDTAADPGGVSVIRVRYSGEKSDALVPAARLGDGLWFRFLSRIESGSSDSPVNAAAVYDAGTLGDSGSAGSDVAGSAVSLPDAAVTELSKRLAGFWRAAGVTDAMRLYRSEAATEFYTYYFSGTRYRRIRYWATDARKRDIMAFFTSDDGIAVPIPKFLEIAGTLYTCVTGTGTLVRNYETGSWTLADGRMSFVPEKTVYAGTAAEYRESAKVTVSGDGSVLAFGEPWLKKTAIADLDAEIAAHNGKTRPPREPLLEFMDLDFRWDDIERIRNHDDAPAE